MSELARLALELVDIPSVSRDERRITAWIAERVERIGLPFLVREPDALVFGASHPDVVLAGHSDTVPAQDNLPGRIEGGAVWGLGASDMKGGLAVMLELAGLVAAGLSTSLAPLFVVFGREELAVTESVLARVLEGCPAILQARLAVVMEPTDNRLQAGCLGSISAELVFRGVAAHSARPWLGVNAIHEAIRGLAPIIELTPQEVTLDGLVFREVLSVTQISGGIANNVVPDLVRCGLNFRYAGHRSSVQAEARLRELVGAGELTVTSNAPAAPVATGNQLLERLRSVGDLELEPKQAWTPVAEFAARGLDAVNFGPGDPALAHRRDERVMVAALERSLEVLRRFLA